jgi:hypothetical protein
MTDPTKTKSSRGGSRKQPGLVAVCHGARAFQLRRGPILFHDFEHPVIERLAGRLFDAQKPLAPTALQKLEGAVMAQWIIAATAEERMGCPR